MTSRMRRRLQFANSSCLVVEMQAIPPSPHGSVLSQLGRFSNMSLTAPTTPDTGDGTVSIGLLATETPANGRPW